MRVFSDQWSDRVAEAMSPFGRISRLFWRRHLVDARNNAMTTGESGTPGRDAPTTSAPVEASAADHFGISGLFGLHRDPSADATRTPAYTVDRWVAATEGTVHGSNDPSARLVHGRYRRIVDLGSGGMRVTYRAWDTQARMIPVVVKMPKREVRRDREVMARCAREIAVMGAAPPLKKRIKQLESG